MLYNNVRTFGRSLRAGDPMTNKHRTYSIICSYWKLSTYCSYFPLTERGDVFENGSIRGNAGKKEMSLEVIGPCSHCPCARPLFAIFLFLPLFCLLRATPIRMKYSLLCLTGGSMAGSLCCHAFPSLSSFHHCRGI